MRKVPLRRKKIPTVFIDGPLNEDWPKADPKVKEDELKAFDEAKKLEQKRKLEPHKDCPHLL